MARSVVDVATYILERTDTITTMKLQKLAFYSQALHLVINGTPLRISKHGEVGRLHPSSMPFTAASS